MTHILDTPFAFATQAIDGLCDLYPTLRRVDGGVTRAVPGPDGKVAVVIGGGSGHYPAFAGYVGKGFADAAVCGEVFASPSTRRVLNVAREAHRGGGVLLGYGNYAGDVLNFDAAAAQLEAEGIEVRSIAVTDDIASADEDHASMRRGVAGDMPVFKIAGAAAEEGLGLDDVAEAAHRANALTRTLGVAFSGCTLPGAAEPLFALERGRMGLGMGVHGEPGIAEMDIASAPVLADMLIERLLRSCPPTSSTRVAAVLNGLGATTHEELFALWSHLAPRLDAAGLELVAPEAGIFISSMDMAGLSLSLTWLEDEMDRWWTNESQAIGFMRPRRSRDAVRPSRVEQSIAGSLGPEGDTSPHGATVAEVVRKVAAALAGAEERLGAIDAQAGDGDHGRGMSLGSSAAARAASAAADSGYGPRAVLNAAAQAWADASGGTSGALWGLLLGALAEAVDDGPINPDALVAGVLHGLDAIRAAGGAEEGDKTMVDAIAPFARALATRRAAGDDLSAAWRAAAQEAQQGAAATAAMTPRRGRARTAGARNVGTPDAGAVSFALVACTVAACIDNEGGEK